MPRSTSKLSDRLRLGDSDRTNTIEPAFSEPKPIRVIRWPELQQKIGGRSWSSVNRAEKSGKFPKRVRQGLHVGWLEHEIDEYLLQLPRGARRA